MRRRKHGQSMVEMAFVLPFLVLITLGIVELGYYIYTYSALENATRRGAERASRLPPNNVGNDNDQCLRWAEDEAIEDAFLTQLNRSHITFNLPDGRKVGERVEVSINYTGNFLTPIGTRFFGSTMTFQFTSRRTIVSTTPPIGYKNDCTSL